MKLYAVCQLKPSKSGVLHVVATFGIYSTEERAQKRIEEMCAYTMQMYNCSFDDIVKECGYYIIPYVLNEDCGDPYLV